jgi:hypothetical protein
MAVTPQIVPQVVDSDEQDIEPIRCQYRYGLKQYAGDDDRHQIR